jgi:hypothetical protein
MTRIGAPAAVAVMALALALAASPDLPVRGAHRAVDGVVAALTVVFVVAVLDRRAPRRLVALGVATLAAALAYDSLRAEHGSMTLAEGQGTPTFERQEPEGRLRSRALGDTVVLERIEPDGTVVLVQTLAERRVRVSARRTATVAGYRVSQPRRVPGGAPRLRLQVSGGAEGQATLREGEKATAGDLEIEVTRYLPDFALDERQQPFSRSREPRNPAALLAVRRGSSSWQAFVMRALPGIHRPAGLDRTLTLVEVLPGEAVALSVHHEPAALLAGLGVLIAAIGVAWSRW